MQGDTPTKDKIHIIEATHHALGTYQLYCAGADKVLFAENESNLERLWGVPNRTPCVKDSINNAIVSNSIELVNPNRVGTKAAAQYRLSIPPGESRTIRLRLKSDNPGSASDAHALRDDSPRTFNKTHSIPAGESLTIHASRVRSEGIARSVRQFPASSCRGKAEADEFYAMVSPVCLSEEHCAVQRQALAGMLWSKQFYHYIIEQWLEGDPGQPPPPPERLTGRNADWRHLYNERVMSMPDKWEFPWYASWDLAFHCIPLALVDPHFAKEQLDIIVREWYQHPNGQIPAYEWNFGDVNPPVLAWASYRVYQIERKQTGKGDRAFLETIFHKMLIAFTWWVNRKDSRGITFFREDFSDSTTSASSSKRAVPRWQSSRAKRWHELMGMFSLNLRIALGWRGKIRFTKTLPQKFFRTLPGDRRGHEQSRWQRHRALG